MENKIIDILKTNVYELSQCEINTDTKLISTGLLDSFDIINIISLLEETYSIKLSLEDIDLKDFNTVENIAGLVNRYVVEQGVN